MSARIVLFQIDIFFYFQANISCIGLPIYIGFPSQFRTNVIQISEWSFNFATKLNAC